VTLIRFRILGPLEFHNGRHWTTLSAPKWQVVLALLLINGNQTITIDQIIDELWGNELPAKPVKTAQVYISRVRQSLNGDKEGRLLSRGSGYQLNLIPAELDIHVFDEHVIRARTELARQRPELAVKRFRAALDLCRGPALAGVPGMLRIGTEAARLDEMRRSALRAHIDARFLLGEIHDLVAELRALTAEYPLDEGFWARFILVLAKLGRQGEALAAFSQARCELIRQLGVEPGDELRQAQNQILHGGYSDDTGLGQLLKPGSRTGRPTVDAFVPRQLPPAIPGFAGRSRPLQQLGAMLVRTRERHSVALYSAVITGDAGIGKTALAVHWAHRVAEHFPDGQLFATLTSGHGQEMVSPSRILRQFIQAIWPSLADLPDRPEELTALYRSLLASRRMLVLLDDACDARQVRPLLPGNPECFVVVTSRRKLAELVDEDGARSFPLGNLDNDEAAELLQHVAMLSQASMDPVAATRMVAECRGRPLALRQAAHGM
jgi:DNA-binding SARP family transcriptional activator